MRVDFYQLGVMPAEAALPAIAGKVVAQGERLLVVSGDTGQLDRIDRALWTRSAESFLAHGKAGGTHDARQPILLSSDVNPANAARYLAIADGAWRDSPEPFERIFYFFDDAAIQPARDCWRMLGQRPDMDRHFWRRDSQRWVEGP